LLVEKASLENKMEQSSLFFTINVVKGLINNGLLENNSKEDLVNKFLSLVSEVPQIAAISYVDETGKTFLFKYDKGDMVTYLTPDDSIPEKPLIIDKKSKNFFFEGDSIIQYPVTSLLSYSNHLTAPYDSIKRYPLQAIPGASKSNGVAYSVRSHDSIFAKDYILTVYMSLKRIYNFISSLHITDSSSTFIYTSDGRYFDFNKISNNDFSSLTAEGYLVPWDSMNGTLFYSAIKQWKPESGTDSLTSYHSFEHLGKDYLAAFYPGADYKNGVWTCYVVPEGDFEVLVQGSLGAIFILSAIFLLISVGAVLFLLRKFLMKNIALEPLTEKELQLLIKKGENDKVEFKSTIRMNLHSNKPGKEIELAWLKSVVAFCNTEGGRIFIGVKDDGEVIGFDADRFSNDDKTLLHIQNLIKQHVGLEFSKYISYKIIKLNGIGVLVIRCLPTSKPVFLKFNEKEQFFVRTGPASIELPVSKALEYIKDRNKS
jgi:hypothetical protein